jgi:hypothetical protein
LIFQQFIVSVGEIASEPAKLPHQGAIAGTFLHPQVLSASTGVATIPVVVSVSNQVFVLVPMPREFIE